MLTRRNEGSTPAADAVRRMAQAALACMPAFLGGCEVIGGIFKAGMWSGIILVIVIVIAIAWAVSRFRGKG